MSVCCVYNDQCHYVMYMNSTGPHNAENVDVYQMILSRYQQNHAASTAGISFHRLRKCVKKWKDEDEDILIESRCQRNPPTFRNIANEINRKYRLTGQTLDRKFTTQDCRNKWKKLFLNTEDTNMTVQYLRMLKKKWPKLMFYPETDDGDDVDGPPTLTALHIVWPWSVDMMNTLAASVFCDATYNVTVYKYKVVCITTLDGNKQHRPLTCSFIMSSSAEQWSTIFDMFHRYKSKCSPKKFCHFFCHLCHVYVIL